MTTNERGTPKPLQGKEWGHSTPVAKQTMYLAGTNGVFLTTDQHLSELSYTRPLLDRTNTPRKALRAITLDRNYTNKRWLYNKTTCDDMNPRLSQTDLKRGKLLRMITRREDKQRRLSPNKPKL